MATETIRVTPQTYAVLKELSQQAGEPMTTVLQTAVEAYRRKRFLEGLNADFAKLRADPEAWADYQAERAEWDCTLMDGLSDAPYDWSVPDAEPTPDPKPSPVPEPANRT